MKIYILMFGSLLLTANVLAQSSGLLNLTGQIDKPHKGKLLKMKESRTKEFAMLNKVNLSPWAPVPFPQTFKNCYAYATVYTARTMLYNITNNILGSPESSVFSPGYLQKLIYKRRGACKSNGDDTYKACQILMEQGAVFKSDYPDDCTNLPLTAELQAEALKYRANIAQLFKQCDADETKIMAIKTSLSEHHPVVIAWFSEENSFNRMGDGLEIWKPAADEINDKACQLGANHAFCILGYDDNKFGPGIGAFYIQNSWTLLWGKNDRLWIAYNDMAQYAEYAVEFSELANNN